MIAVLLVLWLIVLVGLSLWYSSTVIRAYNLKNELNELNLESSKQRIEMVRRDRDLEEKWFRDRFAFVQAWFENQPLKYSLGLGSTSVKGLCSTCINAQPMIAFIPERLVVPSNIAADFLITDIKVGKNSQFISSGVVPAVIFTEIAFGYRLKMDTAHITMFVSVSVTNQNPEARDFQGLIIGTPVQDVPVRP